MPQFKKTIIIVLVTEDERKKGDEFKKFIPGIHALMKKTSGSIVDYDPSKPFTPEQKKQIEIKEDEVSSTRFIIDGHGDYNPGMISTLGSTMDISSECLAKDFSDALGTLHTSQINPLHISIVACKGVLFAKQFQTHLLKQRIYSAIKTRKGFVSVDQISGRKYTANLISSLDTYDGLPISDEYHHVPNSKLIFYIDQNNEQKILDYNYSDKKLHTPEASGLELRKILFDKDSKHFLYYLKFIHAKYGRLSNETLTAILNRIIDFAPAEKARLLNNLVHLLNLNYIRSDIQKLLSSTQYQKLLLLVETHHSYLKEIAGHYSYNEVLQFIKEVLFSADRLRVKFKNQINELPASDQEKKQFLVDLENLDHLCKSEHDFTNIQKNGLAGFAVLTKNTPLLSSIMKDSKNYPEAPNNKDYLRLLFLTLQEGTLEHFKIIIGKNIEALTQYYIPDYWLINKPNVTFYEYALLFLKDSTSGNKKEIYNEIVAMAKKTREDNINVFKKQITEQLQLFDEKLIPEIEDEKGQFIETHFEQFIENDAKLKDLQETFMSDLACLQIIRRLKQYISEHDFSQADSVYTVQDGTKKLPKIVLEHFKILSSESLTLQNATKIYMSIMTSASLAKENPPSTSLFAMFWSEKRSSETALYIDNLTSQKFDFFSEKTSCSPAKAC